MKYAIYVLALTVLVSSSAVADLRLELSSSRTNYLLHEPLYVTLRIKNAGSLDAYFINALNPAWSLLSLEITPPGESARQYNKTSHADWDYRSSDPKEIGMRLAPGEEFSEAVNLTNEMGKGGEVLTLLRNPGEYRIRAVYEIPANMPCGPLRLESDEFRLEVSEPQGPDMLAYGILMSARKRSKGEYFWSYNAANADCYETVIRECPESRYRIYATYYLAGVHTVPYLLNRKSPESRLEMEKAVSLCRSIIEDTRGTEFGVQATFQAAFAAARAGMPIDAARFREEAFLSPAATNRDRITVLQEMELVRSLGLEGKAGPESEGMTSGVPLRRFAEALGFSVNWDSDSRSVTIARKGTQGKLYPGRGVFVINGKKYVAADVSVRGGDWKVSHSVIATLMVNQYGKGMENALSAFVAKEVQTRKP